MKYNKKTIESDKALGWTRNHRCTCAEQVEYWGSYFCRTPASCRKMKRRPIHLRFKKKIEKYDEV